MIAEHKLSKGSWISIGFDGDGFWFQSVGEVEEEGNIHPLLPLTWNYESISQMAFVEFKGSKTTYTNNLIAFPLF